MRYHHDIPIRRREDVPLRRLGDVPLRRHWVFYSRRTCNVTGTYRETSLQRCHDVLLQGGTVFKNLKMGLHAICTDHTDDLIYNFEVHKGNTDVFSSETVLQASGNITMRILVSNPKHNG